MGNMTQNQIVPCILKTEKGIALFEKNVFLSNPKHCLTIIETNNSDIRRFAVFSHSEAISKARAALSLAKGE